MINETAETRKGDWIQTFTGKAFYPFDPRPEEIDLRDIGHALSNICRFGGHTAMFYSVAEHSVLLAGAVAKPFKAWALLHDAAEAYIGDIPRPIKRSIPQFAEAEGLILEAIARRFGLSPFIPKEVHEADNRILFDEAARVLGERPMPWRDEKLPLGVTISFWNPPMAEKMWMKAVVKELYNYDLI